MRLATAPFPGTLHLDQIFEAIRVMPELCNSGCDDPSGQREEDVRPRTADE